MPARVASRMPSKALGKSAESVVVVGSGGSATVQIRSETLTNAETERLRSGLFDAFTGRDPGEPAPIAALIHDLVGEFSNMVCGAWLTRVESGLTFTLSHPSVEPALTPAEAGDLRLVAAIDDLPVAVDVRLQPLRRTNGVARA